jgi:PAS domain S-box-containing protein
LLEIPPHPKIPWGLLRLIHGVTDASGMGLFCFFSQGEEALMVHRPTYEELEQKVKKLEQQAVQHKQLESRLIESEREYRNLLDSSVVGVYETNLDGDILYVNETLAKMFEFESPEEMMSESVLIRYKSLKDREVLIDTLRRLGKVTNFEFKVLTKAGKTKTALLSAALDGKIISGMIMDLTELKHAKGALEQSSIDMLDMVESISDGFFSLDDQFVVTYFNEAAERLLGRRSWEILGHNFFEAFPECKGSVFEDKFTTGVNEKLPISFETYFDIEPYENWYEVRVYPRNKGILVFFRVTTEQKQTEEEKRKLEVQLQQTEKMKAIGVLAGGIANSFNNVLSVMEGIVSLMLSDIDATHPHKKRLKDIEKQIQRGSKLSARLLGYAGKGRYEARAIDLNQVVEETSEAFSRIREETKIRLDLADDLFAIEADPSQIEQVLSNLYMNAADAMPGGGDLVLKTMNMTHKDIKHRAYDPTPGNYVLLTVADTGTGMDQDTVEHVYEPFFSTKDMDGESGLGLTSAYGIVKGHGGHIDVTSARGCGSTFSICLPASGKSGEITALPSDKIVRGTGTVLLVDDEAAILDIGVEMLKRLGYSVLEAKGGHEAVKVYESKKDGIDLVILDMIMPDMHGCKVYDKLKEINPQLRVLLSSGFSIDGQATQILESGCDGFIQKPFTMKELSQQIWKILEK